MGNAHACAPGDQKQSIISAASDVCRTVVFHHGIDLAFAVGFGAAMDKADVDCAAVLAHINEIKAKMGLGDAK